MAHPTPNRPPEWGRELLAHELQVKTVVIFSRDGFTAFSAWVREVCGEFVALKMGVISTMLILRRLPDGTLVDDTNKQIHIYEYVGKVDA
jgi:hypothetical protein